MGGEGYSLLILVVGEGISGRKKYFFQVEVGSIFAYLRHHCTEGKPVQFSVVPFSSVRFSRTDENLYRRKLRKLSNFLFKTGSVTLFTYFIVTNLSIESCTAALHQHSGG